MPLQVKKIAILQIVVRAWGGKMTAKEVNEKLKEENIEISIVKTGEYLHMLYKENFLSQATHAVDMKKGGGMQKLDQKVYFFHPAYNNRSSHVTY